MKTPCITSWCLYWVSPKSKSWLCEKCGRLKRKRELRAEKKEVTIIYNKDWTISTYEQICDRLRYAEEELECIDMFFKKRQIPDNLWLSRIWKISILEINKKQYANI